jgi:hypothetical protein
VRLLLAVAVGIALASASLALASPQFSSTFDLTYTSRVPGAASGQVPLMTWTDPGAPNEVPKIIKRIKLTFHKGTSFDTAALGHCHASDKKILSTGGAACPKASRLGTGHTTGVFSNGSRFVTDVTLFNARGEIVVVVLLNGTPITEFRDEVKGRTITIEPVLPSGVSLERLKLRIGKHSKGERTYMRNPPACPRSGQWTTVAKFTYVDGSHETLRDRSRCKSGA